ncbi:Peptidyl-prolyl isomerase cwc27 [Thecaphora frezii]
MASVYVTEPPTEGRILLVTSKGDIEVELWPKEAPKACRNIIALALEGYYDNCIFHRIVPGFCIQTGDPTGSGMGGESFYGQPFDNEPHQRLKFNKRGMVAMANTGDFATNESQFFITLDATPELQGKFTIFGRVVGQTIYNVLAISEVELRKDELDRPVYPPKLLRVDVLDNPFDDIVPRITRDEKWQQLRAKKQAAERKAKERERKSVKKNTALLSFGEAEETADAPIKGPKSSHDLLSDKKLSKQRAMPEASAVASASTSPHRARQASRSPPAGNNGSGQTKKRSHKEPPSATAPGAEDLASLRANTRTKESAAEQIRALEASIRGLSRPSHLKRAADGDASEAKQKVRRGRELLAQARAKYFEASQAESRAKAKLKDGDEETVRLLAGFQERMRQREDEANASKERGKTKEQEQEQEQEDEEQDEEAREYGASDDDDADWRNHRYV